MAQAASQLKKRAVENINAVEDEKEKKRAARKRAREAKRKKLLSLLVFIDVFYEILEFLWLFPRLEVLLLYRLGRYSDISVLTSSSSRERQIIRSSAKAA
ncbi:unnamed protein product [Pleuronectes platessa]|uniref:Uncharacterized protein n=1 Tax=Pleuronectes platessa TaxID=8262 RepID=A0A9N7Y276_PLEPL|nr:unnamed protein product [Pleuronectes platessa]